MSPISVLFIDRNAIFLRLATSVFRHYHQNEVEISGAVGTSEAALALDLDMHPQVVLLGLGSSGLDDLALIPQLRRSLPQVGVIVLGLVDAPGYDDLARAAGADAFVRKASMSTDLLPAVRRVAQVRQRAGSSDTPHACDADECNTTNKKPSYADTGTLNQSVKQLVITSGS